MAGLYHSLQRLHPLTQVLATGLLLFCSYTALSFTVNSARPATWWAEYSHVKPVKEVFEKGDSIIMRTTVHIRRPVDLQFHDVLFCKIRGDDEFTYVSDYDSASRHAEAKYIGYPPSWIPEGLPDSVPRLSGRWKYGGSLPKTPAICRMVSDITWSPSLGVTKRVQIESGTFSVVPDSP